jgi:hypothetical protein
MSQGGGPITQALIKAREIVVGIRKVWLRFYRSVIAVDSLLRS